MMQTLTIAHRARGCGLIEAK
jgi:hypothetical protein